MWWWKSCSFFGTKYPSVMSLIKVLYRNRKKRKSEKVGGDELCRLYSVFCISLWYNWILIVCYTGNPMSTEFFSVVFKSCSFFFFVFTLSINYYTIMVVKWMDNRIAFLLITLFGYILFKSSWFI